MPTFDPSTTEFSLDNAFFLATACQVAYETGHVDGALATAWPTLDGVVTEFSNGRDDATDRAVTGFVDVSDDAVVLCFRGTANLEGWLTDFNAVQTAAPRDPMYAHYGFYHGLSEVWSQILAALPATSGPRGIWVTGHSLGGAIATLATVQLLDAGYTVNGTYTYGSPRVGNPNFCAAFNAQGSPPSFRFVNNDDIVPRVPADTVDALNRDPLALFKHPANLFKRTFTYKHVGIEKYITHDGKIGDPPAGFGAISQFVGGAVDMLKKAKPASLEDHRIANYIAAIKNALPA